MNTPPAAPPRTVSRKPATKTPAEQLAPLYCPHVDDDLDGAVAFDVGDPDELTLRAVIAGESTRPFPPAFAAER